MNRTHSEAVLATLRGLDEVKELLSNTTLRMWQADNGGIYTIDLLANGCIHRTLAHIRGLRAMILDFNMICVGPLVRMQIDTALRFHAAYLAPQALDFAQAVLSGTAVHKLRTRDGNAMRDAVLVESLTHDYPWVERIYKQASGFVHFSDLHVAGTYGKPDREASKVPLAITGQDGDYPDTVYTDTIGTFRAAIEIFVDHLNGWIKLKEAQPNSTIVSLNPPPDEDFSQCRTYLDIGRKSA